jgi:hypothetical protein
MASVFLSYDRDDAAKAGPIAHALERAGHQVWWDRHIKSGAQFSKEIEAALKRADAVVVLWSVHSIDSPWVRDEAANGRDTNRLVPALIGKVEPPLGFRQYQAADLTGWKGRPGSTPFQDMLRTIEELGGEPKPEPTVVRRTFAPSRPAMLTLTAIAVLIVAGLLFWRPWAVRPPMPVIAVTAASQSSSARAMAQELFVRLGAAQSGRTGSVQLVHEAAKGKPDLILEVSGTQSAANLVLLHASDRQLLYSQDLAAPPNRPTDVRPSLEIAAAATVNCAADALTSQARLPFEVLKDYLQACAQFSSLYGSEEAYIPLTQLEQVVQREPRFLPAWKQLLLAGAFMRSVPTDNMQPSEQWLRTMIRKASLVDADMPAIRIAELHILPMTDFANRMRLVDGLQDANPDDPFVLGARAEQLMIVGRNFEAVETAERAVRLHPLSPYSRSEYVRTLAFSGRDDRAAEEIGALNVLDEVAMNLTETKFRVNLTAGDPQSALAIFRLYGTNKRNEALMLARIDPTQANQERAIGLARADADRRGFYGSYSEVLLAFGREDEAFGMLMSIPRERADQFLLQTLFRPTLNRLRERPRFLLIAQRYGLLDYWRKSGNWPDFCNEPGLPYDCKTEAAKLPA